MLGNGDGTFQTQTIFLSSSLASVAVADFNGDGALDVAASVATGGFIAVVPNTGGSKVTLTSSKKRPHVGETISFTSRVTPTIISAQPTGTVSFYSDNTLLGNVPLINGRAKFSTSALTAGKHQIQAIYSGDAVFVSNKSKVIKQVVTAQSK